MQHDRASIDAPAFLSAVAAFRDANGAPCMRDESQGGDFDWAAFGRASAHLFRTAPNVSFMCVAPALAASHSLPCQPTATFDF